MAADGRITIDFDMDLAGLKSDGERANEIMHGIGSDAGDKMDESFRQNTNKIEQTADKAKEHIDSKFSKETKVKLVTDAKTAGIDNFEKILNKLPKEVQTELLAKADKGEAINYEELLQRIPTKITSTAHLNDDASPKLEQIQNEAGRTEEKFSSLKTAVGGGIVGGVVATSLQSAASGIASLGSEAIEASDSIYKFKSTMKLGGFGEKEINSASKEVQKYANETVYELGDVSNTTAQLAANGVKGYMKLTEAAGNLNAQAGGNADTFKSVAMMLTQTAGAGKLTTENWNQLADAIPGASGVLQKAMKENGAYTGNFRDAMAAGKISSDEFNKALMQLGMNDGAKKAAKSTETFEGAFGNLKANIVTGMQEMLQEVGKKNLTNAINGASDAVVSLTGFFIKLINAMQEHKNIVVGIGAALATVFAVKKITDFIIYLGKAKTALLEFQAVSSVTGLGGSAGGLLSKGAQTATLAGGVGTVAEGTGLVATGSRLLSGVAKASPYLAAGAGVVSEVTSKNSTSEKVGGSIGSTAGAIAGGMLGSLAGPIGTAVGSAGGAWIGKKLGETIGSKAQEALKGKPITAKVKMKTDKDASAIQKALAPSLKKLSKELVLNTGIDPKSITKTQEASSKLFRQMSKDVDAYYKNKEKSSAKDLQSLVKQGVMTQKQADADLKKQKKSDENQRKQKQAALAAMQKDTNAYYKQVSKIQNDSTKSESQKEKAIEKAHKKFIKDYVKDEYSMNTSTIKNVQKGVKQQQSIYNQLIKDKGKLNTQDLKATQKHANDLYNTSVKSAKKTRDDVVDAANSKYDKTKKIADHEYNDLHSISKKQHQKILNEADGQRDDTVKAATDQYNKVTKKATDQHKKVTDEITQQKNQVSKTATDQALQHEQAANGEMSTTSGTYSSGFKSIGKIWHGFTKWIGKILKVFDTSKSFPDQPGSFAAYAKGSGGLPTNQIALVGEEGFEIGRDAQGFHILGAQGPEIRHLSAGTSILPHNQSMALMRKMGIPGYKDGAGDLLGDIGDDVMDVFSMIGKGTSSLWSWIKDKTGIDKLIEELTPKGLVKDVGKGSFDIAKDAVAKTLTHLLDSFGGGSSPAGTMSMGEFAKVATIAAAMMHQSLSAADIAHLYFQAGTESSVNPAQGGGYDDHDGTGLPVGLFQYKLGTWGSWAVPGHKNIHSALDQIMAVLNDSSWRKDFPPMGVKRGWAHPDIICLLMVVGHLCPPSLVRCRVNQNWQLIPHGTPQMNISCRRSKHVQPKHRTVPRLNWLR